MAKEAIEKSTPEAPVKAPESVVATSANDTASEPKGKVFGDRELKRGDSGEDVKSLQVRLGIEPSGHFNEATERKINWLQRVKGQKETGKVDSDFRKLFKI